MFHIALFPLAAIFISISAQSVTEVRLLNLQWQATGYPTLTFQGSDATATTYVQSCPTKDPITTTTRSVPNAPSIVQQSSSTPFARSNTICVGLSVIQGPSTWQFNATATPALSLNAKCKWTGEMTVADITCTGTLQGEIYQTSIADVDTFRQEDLIRSRFWDTATIVSMGAVMTTGTSFSGSVFATPTQSSSSSSALGIRADAPMPTGLARGFVAGVIGVWLHAGL
ncbi:hypothetical protein B0J11DRAFT_573383 [Dendryphion nanum]|uniref:Uncharacterized protein n=1 Tax=Dendryphion nanum TaxID=256645 RepID=A0A9P9D1G9_9PLEO|nr:hypothetical protein B0J11DRAFT_573383 [Dendryphion nanum]